METEFICIWQQTSIYRDKIILQKILQDPDDHWSREQFKSGQANGKRNRTSEIISGRPIRPGFRVHVFNRISQVRVPVRSLEPRVWARRRQADLWGVPDEASNPGRQQLGQGLNRDQWRQWWGCSWAFQCQVLGSVVSPSLAFKTFL